MGPTAKLNARYSTSSRAREGGKRRAAGRMHPGRWCRLTLLNVRSCTRALLMSHRVSRVILQSTTDTPWEAFAKGNPAGNTPIGTYQTGTAENFLHSIRSFCQFIYHQLVLLPCSSTLIFACFRCVNDSLDPTLDALYLSMQFVQRYRTERGRP